MNQKTNIVITPDPEKQQVTILLEGDITLQNIAGLKRDLLAIIKQYNNIVVETKDVKNVDLSCIQLLYALRKSTNKHKQQLTCV